MDNTSMCRLGSFSRMLCSGSYAEFCQCLPVVLRVHILSAYCRDVYQENGGEVLPKFCVGSGAEHGKTNPIYTYSGGIRTYLYLLAFRLHGRNKTERKEELEEAKGMVQSWKASYEGNDLVGENAVDVPRWVCSESKEGSKY